MTISTTASSVTVQGNGSQTIFGYSFLIPLGSDWSLWLTDTSGGQTLLDPSVYAVTGVGSSSGGTFTYPLAGGTPIAAGTSLTLIRNVPEEQETSLGNQGAYYPSVVEAALDWIVMQVQDLNRKFGQSISAPPADGPLHALPSAKTRANTALMFDSNGNPTAAAATVPSAGVSTAMQPVLLSATTPIALESLGGVTFVGTISALRAATTGTLASTTCIVANYATAGDQGGGTFAVDASDTTSADNGGTIIVDAAGRRWYRQYSGAVNVRWFGAVGNGTTNDAPAIQAAISSLPTSGGAVFFPAGNYGISAQINAPATTGANNNLLLFGEGVSSNLVPLASVTNLLSSTGGNFEAKNLSFSNASSFASVGLRSDIASSNAGLSAYIHDCQFIGFTQSGISIQGQNYSVNNNFFQNNLNHIEITDDGRNSEISGNYALGGSTGILSQIVSQQPEGLRIINNTFLCTGASGASVNLSGGLEILISSNIFDQNGTGTAGVYANIFGTNALSKIKMIGNWIVGGLNSYSIFLSGNVSDVSSTENTIIGSNGAAQTAGISFSGVTNYRIINNNFQVVTGPDLSIASSTGGTILGNESTQSSSNATQNLLPNLATVTPIFASNDVSGTSVSVTTASMTAPTNGRIIGIITGSCSSGTAGSGSASTSLGGAELAVCSAYGNGASGMISQRVTTGQSTTMTAGFSAGTSGSLTVSIAMFFEPTN